MRDALQRRLRFAPPQPLGKRLQVDDLLPVFEAIHRHGPLPSHFLQPFGTTANKINFQHRLTDLYHEKYLTRPSEQFDSFGARYQNLVYDLHKNGEMLLSAHGLLSPYIKRGDPFVHRLMGACIGASIELACRARGLKFISRHDILSRKQRKMSLPLRSSRLVPDELFGIEYPDGETRFFAVEYDRNTERLQSTKEDQTVLATKLDAYMEVARTSAYKEEWGISKMLTLICTTNQTRAESLARMAGTLEYPRRFLFKVFPNFGPPWKMPQIFTEVLEPWMTSKGDFDITRP